MRSGFINVCGGGSKYPGSHTSAGSLSFKKLLIDGYEWVRIQHRLCTRRGKNWHGLHEGSYCYCMVYVRGGL